MDANTSALMVKENIIITVTLALFCRAMWKFLNRVNVTGDTDITQVNLARKASLKDSNNNVFLHQNGNNQQKHQTELSSALYPEIEVRQKINNIEVDSAGSPKFELKMLNFKGNYLQDFTVDRSI